MGRLALLLFLLSLLSSSIFAATKKSSLQDRNLKLWGTEFLWVTPSSVSNKEIERALSDLRKNSRAYDPDCLWTQDAKSKCEDSPLPKVTSELDALAASLKAETDGAFDVILEKEGKKFRDYGGLVQGYVLENLKKTPGKWSANFAGDFFVPEGAGDLREIYVGDWGMSGLPFAKVKMNSGWVIGSLAPENGSAIIDPATKSPKSKADFQKIVLFAKPEFNGSRLDAWSTALIIGGKPLLKKLRELKAYEGQWEYFYADSSNNLICSKNLKCKLFGSNRTIVTPW